MHNHPFTTLMQSINLCCSTSKSALFYSQFTRLSTKRNRRDEESNLHLIPRGATVLSDGQCANLRYDGKGESSSSLPLAACTDSCTPCPALGLMVMTFWTICICVLLCQAAKGFLRELETEKVSRDLQKSGTLPKLNRISLVK